MEVFRIIFKLKLLASFAYAAGLLSLVLIVILSLTGGNALAAPPTATAPGLGAAAAFSALGKAGVTNTGPSVLSGKVGADSSITGFPPGNSGGSVLAPEVNGAEADASAADLALTAQTSSAVAAGPNLTGLSLVPGVYNVGAAILPGNLTLNGAGVYVFLATELTSNGSVILTNGATACNVFWHVTSGASITGGSFVGTVIAGTSVTFGNAARLDGRALALTGNVTLVNTTISGTGCGARYSETTVPVKETPEPTTIRATATPTVMVIPATATPAAVVPTTTMPGATALPTTTTIPVGIILTYTATMSGATTLPTTTTVPVGIILTSTATMSGATAAPTATTVPVGIILPTTTMPGSTAAPTATTVPVGIILTSTTTMSGATALPTTTTVPVGIILTSTATMSGATSAPTTSAPVVSATSVIGANAGMALLPVTGADRVENSIIPSHQRVQVSLGFLGLGLFVLGFVMWRKHSK